MKNELKSNKPTPTTSAKKDPKTPGYPKYPASDDIYKNSKEEKDIDPDDFTKVKPTNSELVDQENEIDLDEEILYGDDLDVPGAELDDEREEIGNEDEENNYYSIGGDRHKELEEDEVEEIDELDDEEE